MTVLNPRDTVITKSRSDRAAEVAEPIGRSTRGTKETPMKRLILAMVALSALSCISAGPNGAVAAKPDKEAIQGT